MTARKFVLVTLTFSLALLAGTVPVRAQDEPQPPAEGKPKPAGTSTPIPLVNSGDIQNQGDDNNNLAPDNTPLTGVLNPTLGSPEIIHSYWVPGIQWSGTIQSKGYNQTQNSGWLMNNYILGNLSVLKAWRTSQFAVNYSAVNTGIQASSQSFNTGTVGGGVSRPAGRNGTFAIADNADITNYGQAGCVGTACSSTQTYNYVTINFQWHTRPLILP